MHPLGFSTGALARGNFRLALAMMSHVEVDVVELSALRLPELEPLIDYCFDAVLDRFRFVSVHAPARFPAGDEEWIVEALCRLADRGWPIVLHPDAIHNPVLWRRLGPSLLVENMDKRKGLGRTALELTKIFSTLDEACLCFDMAHARQVDSSMTEAYRILERFGNRVRQIHLSEVSSSSRHDRMSRTAVLAYRGLAPFIPPSIPVVLEAPVTDAEMLPELMSARAALDVDPVLAQ